jgi:hypothetical protein
MRINLQVPYKDKDRAKKLGAKWCRIKKCWYILNETNLMKFWEWIPSYLKKPYKQTLSNK